VEMEYKREPLEEEEIQDLRKSCKTFEEEYITNVLLETGMRISELVNLKEEDISWQRNFIKVIGKGNKRRIIPLSNLAKHYVTEFFKSKKCLGITPRWVQIKLKNIADKARIKKPVSPHVLRHTFAVNYLHKGGNVRALQAILGHSSLITTEVYLNYSGTRVLEDFNKIWDN